MIFFKNKVNRLSPKDMAADLFIGIYKSMLAATERADKTVLKNKCVDILNTLLTKLTEHYLWNTKMFFYWSEVYQEVTKFRASYNHD